MRYLLLLVCLMPLAAGCEEKAPSQTGPKAVTVKETGGTTP